MVLAPSAGPRLRAERMSPGDWVTLETGADPSRGQQHGLHPPHPQHPPLGGLGYGVPRADGLAERLLGEGGARVDAWFGGADLERGRCGSVAWRHDGHWLYGTLELDEAREPAGLAALAERAYRDVFASLAHTGCDHLLRVWNYLPAINADGGGLERYRQFNLGRQQAFLDAGRAAFDGAPAACAMGTRDGPFRLHFLAGRVPALAIENPRQVSAYRYPAAYGPCSPTFSRAALVEAGQGQLALFISGTASVVGHASAHVGDVEAQTHETLANLRAVIDAARARCSARFELALLDCIVYVRLEQDWPAIRAVLQGALGAEAPALRGAVALQADICRSDLLVEIEAHAFEPGELLK
ncbi:Rid family hydrolase [Methylibium sp.]|uniref:chorismate transformation enzyme, FkbO/Hyg5 family n=1 Tax=Methylibium sp. TaxID=2067992 RepID=UPI00286C8B9D|nr:Rid family hydrolase [Methylibium sp.]